MTRPRLTNHGRVSGALLMLLGAWGALIPFVGPYFGFAYQPDVAWTYNSGRLWLSILPGAAAFLGGLIVVASDRAAPVGGLLAALGGAWYVAGQHVTAIFASSIHPGSPAVATNAVFGAATMKFLEQLGFFYGLGALIVFFAALAIGRVTSARSAEKNYGEDLFDFGDAETKPYSNRY
jgi:hypothetical protein